MMPSLGWAAVIALLSLMSTGGTPMLPLFGVVPVDKAAHFAVYLILAYLLLVGTQKQYTINTLRYYSIPVSLTVAVLYGVLMELLQGFVIMDRNLEFYDIVANTAGSFSGLGVFWLVYLK